MKPKRETADAIHVFFELTYASYLVLPRSALQSMPEDWQRRFVAMVDEVRAAFGHLERDGQYTVYLRDKKGRFISDPLADYQRGRRRLETRP